MIPIYIFSLPRSGSTLLQKIIASNPEVYTLNETWFLLPFISARKKEGSYSLYGHKAAATAIDDFITQIPEGEEKYTKELHDFIVRIYSHAARDRKYFLDKTPRYHYYINEITTLLPESLKILLFRNPLSIVASILETFGSLHVYNFDLYHGIRSLINYSNKLPANSIKLNYEDIVLNSDKIYDELSSFLGLNYDKDNDVNFKNINLKLNKFGTPSKNNYKPYSGISDQSLDKWKEIIGKSILRKNFCINYVNWLGEDNLKTMGYNYKELIFELRTIEMTNEKLFFDFYSYFKRIISHTFEPVILRDKLNQNFKYWYAHR